MPPMPVTRFSFFASSPCFEMKLLNAKPKQKEAKNCCKEENCFFHILVKVVFNIICRALQKQFQFYEK
jgi:hypothetical protein